MRTIAISLRCLVLLSLLISGCYEVRTEPRTLTLDGSIPPVDALTGTSPSACFPTGADTLLLGPEPGCLEVTIGGSGDGEDPIPARGTPLRMVNTNTSELQVRLELQSRCGSSTSPYMVTWLQEHCDRGQSVVGQCGDEPPDDVVEVPFDELAQDGILEALVGGEGVSIHFTACAIRRR